MGIEDYVAVAKDISLELLDRIENKHLVDYRNLSLKSSKIEAVQKAYENWMKAIILGEIIPALSNFDKLAGNHSKAMNIVANNPQILNLLDPQMKDMVALTKPLIESPDFLQEYQSSFMDATLTDLISRSNQSAIKDFLAHKLNHDLHWFFNYASNMQKLEAFLPPTFDEKGKAIERGYVYGDIIKEVDSNKPCLVCIHENPKYKPFLDMLNKKPEEFNINLPLTPGPDLIKMLNSVMHHALIAQYAALIVRCLKKYQSEPRFTGSEDANMNIEFKFIPFAVEILENNYGQNRLFIDKLIPNLVSYFENGFVGP